jgi:hypothetical protein
VDEVRWEITRQDWDDALGEARRDPPLWAVRVMAVLLLVWWYAHELWDAVR